MRTASKSTCFAKPFLGDTGATQGLLQVTQARLLLRFCFATSCPTAVTSILKADDSKRENWRANLRTKQPTVATKVDGNRKFLVAQGTACNSKQFAVRTPFELCFFYCMGGSHPCRAYARLRTSTRFPSPPWGKLPTQRYLEL